MIGIELLKILGGPLSTFHDSTEASKAILKELFVKRDRLNEAPKLSQ